MDNKVAQTKKYNLLVWLTIALAFIVRIANIRAFAVHNDASLYGFRAMGWFDFLDSPGQTTPIQWFGHIPWWANLSFHDAPPLVFAIQKIFFNILGDNIVAMRLPGIIASLICAYLVYVIVRRFYGNFAGLVASIILAFSSFSVWTSISGNLEAVEVLFITLTLFFVLHFVREPNRNKWLYLSTLGFGLAILSKYTAIFLIPAIVLFIIFWHRKTIKIKSKRVFTALLIFLVLLSPVIVYNTMVYITRGHLDSPLSAMFGMHPDDFRLVSSQSTNTNFVANLEGFGHSMFDNNSIAILLLTVLSVIYLAYKFIFKKTTNDLERLIFLSIFMAVLMFTFSGASERWLGILMPFIAISISIFIFSIIKIVKSKGKNILTYSLTGLFCLLIVGEFFYSVNTNVLPVPVLKAPLFYSNSRFYDDGSTALGDYIKNVIITNPNRKKRPQTTNEMAQFTSEGIKGQKLIFFDTRIHWFSYMWYLYPYRAYYHWPMMSVSNLLKGPPEKILQSFKKANVKDFYLIYITHDGPMDATANEIYSENTNYEEVLDDMANRTKPVATFKNAKGVVTFKIFKL